MIWSVFFSFAAFLITANAIPQGIFFGKDGQVGASFGGYTASAGLGGLLGGGTGTRGGLFAQAGTPHGHAASAGLGGNVGGEGTQGAVYSGAVKPSKYGMVYSSEPAVQYVQPVTKVKTFVQAQPVEVQPQPVVVEPQPVVVQPQPIEVVQSVPKPVGTFYRPKGSFYNDIFNIPISTLQAVNKYLNNKSAGVAVVPVAPVYLTGRSNTETEVESESKTSSASTSYAASASSNADSSSSSSSNAASASASSSSSSGAEDMVPVVPVDAVPGILVTKTYPTKFDNIFNIPISVLRSVNNLLNG